MNYDLLLFLSILILFLIMTLFVYPFNNVDNTDNKNNVQKYDTDWTVRGNVEQIVDKKSGVVCYTYDHVNGGGGISCLPINQTNISIGESQD